MHHDPARVVESAARRSARAAGQPLLLAVSGGLDSMVLLRAMSAVARRRVAGVASFDHGTGAAATQALALVREECVRVGIPFVGGRMDDAYAVPDGREAAWRSARHRFLRETAASMGARVVTAHTADDQLETVLMRVMRGTGARGLAGLYAEGAVLRPFVHLRRTVLEAFARAADVAWMDDPSNSSREFTRNRVRHDLLPALRETAPALDAELLSLAARAALLRRDVEAFVTRQLRPQVDGSGRLVVASRELAGYDRDALAVLWGALAGRVGLALDRSGTRRLAEFTMQGATDGVIQLAGGWCLLATSDAYIIERDAAPLVPEVASLPVTGTLEWGRFRFRVSDRAEAASPWSASIGQDEARVRVWTAGDRLASVGGQRTRRVKRYLSDVGLRGREREQWPVVLNGDEVVWIPGVRRSDAATDRSGRPARHYVCERIDR